MTRHTRTPDATPTPRTDTQRDTNARAGAITPRHARTPDTRTDGRPTRNLRTHSLRNPDAYGGEPDIRDMVSEERPAPPDALRLTRAQRRGVPVMARERMASVTIARDLTSRDIALGRVIGMAGSMARVCYRRGWPNAGNLWAGAVAMAEMVGRGERRYRHLDRWITDAERATYHAANATGESGGRARSRRRRRKPDG